MRVLLMGGPGPNFEEARRDLEASDHEVVVCHDHDEPVFPCKGFRAKCPLDEAHVDVALVVRNHAWPRPTAFDRGATCAIRQKVPVAVTGVGVLNPYEEWTEATVPRGVDLVSELELMAGAPRTDHGDVATAALRASLTAAGLDAGDARATVTRRDGWLRVELSDLPELPRLKGQNAARRIIGALRNFDRHARGIDVAFADDPRAAEGARWSDGR